MFSLFVLLTDSADSPRRSSYEPEISPAAIKRIIADAMADNNVTKEDIPNEPAFTTPAKARGSKRYFETKGFAWLNCPGGDNRWPSAHCWCFIDLKKQTICYRDPQDCKKCESEVDPEFTEESVERMAEYAVRGFLIKTGELHAVFNPRVDDDDMGTQRGPHDEERCGRCRRLGTSCWK